MKSSSSLYELAGETRCQNLARDVSDSDDHAISNRCRWKATGMKREKPLMRGYSVLSLLAMTIVVLCSACSGGGGASTTTGGGTTGSTGKPCDVFASASPCVAAFSTVRSLYVSYSGPLYQVTRASDSTTLDIALLADGYANAAAQNTFCAATTCTITKIYDQSANHNDLTVAPPGGADSGKGPNGYDLPAVANALPITAGGHSVYGVLINPGMGYRRDITTGIAVNGQAEGVYMVSSPYNLDAGCCFDFGNAESNDKDNGAGHMDAINFQCTTSSLPCVPITGLDMENGIFGKLGTLGTLPFVTVIGANNGQNSYTIWQGNSQAGALSSTGATTLPSGYSPMKQEGGIILGIGGDNSNRSSGCFFEGAMTMGVPSSSALNNVQANIVSAGYIDPTGKL